MAPIPLECADSRLVFQYRQCEQVDSDIHRQRRHRDAIVTNTPCSDYVFQPGYRFRAERSPRVHPGESPPAGYPVRSGSQREVRQPGRDAIWELMRKLSKMAEDEKLDQESPYKETLAYARMNVLLTAEINAAMNRVVGEPGDIVKYYDSNKQKYTQVRVKAIYIAFSDDAAAISASKGKKPLTEAEAKTKAAKLLAAIKGGADFVKLVKDNSDDETSREKDGEFATLRSSDNIPDAFRAAVFALKKGDVSEPLKQPNGFYLLRAEEVTVRPLSEVRDEIYNDLKTARSDEWLRGIDSDAQVQIVTPAFISGTPAPAKQ